MLRNENLIGSVGMIMMFVGIVFGIALKTLTISVAGLSIGALLIFVDIYVQDTNRFKS